MLAPPLGEDSVNFDLKEAEKARLSNRPFFPRHFGLLVLVGALVLWLVFLELEHKIHGFIGAMTFACVEFLFRGVRMSITAAGRLSARLILLNGFTTLEQWAMNLILMTPWALLYRWVFPPYWQRVLLFPAFVWIGEIIGGYFMYLFWPRRAWVYNGKGSFFHGNIDFYFVHYWIIFAVPYELIAEYIFAPTSAQIARALVSLVSLR